MTSSVSHVEDAGVAQLVEHFLAKEDVARSNRVTRSILHTFSVFTVSFAPAPSPAAGLSLCERQASPACMPALITPATPTTSTLHGLSVPAPADSPATATPRRVEEAAASHFQARVQHSNSTRTGNDIPWP